MIKRAAIAVIAVCTVTACGCSTRSTEHRSDFTPLSPEIVSPYYGGLEKPSYRIVRTPGEWAELWRELEPRTSREQGQLGPNPVPQIDFGRYAVIVAAMGRRPNGGYSIEVDSLNESADRIVVAVAEKAPGANCATTQALTYPIAIVLVPQTAKQVDFEVLQKTHDCG